MTRLDLKLGRARPDPTHPVPARPGCVVSSRLISFGYRRVTKNAAGRIVRSCDSPDSRVLPNSSYRIQIADFLFGSVPLSFPHSLIRVSTGNGVGKWRRRTDGLADGLVKIKKQGETVAKIKPKKRLARRKRRSPFCSVEQFCIRMAPR